MLQAGCGSSKFKCLLSALVCIQGIDQAAGKAVTAADAINDAADFIVL